MKRQTGLIAASLLGLLVAALGGPLLTAAPAAAADTGCYVDALLVNSCRPWFGATAGNYPQVASDKTSQIQYFEARAGRSLDVVHTYHSAADSALSSTDVFFATRPDTYLFTNWRVTETWADAGGGDAAVNARIDAMAASIKALGSRRIFLTLSHEPENHLSSDPNCPSLTYVGTDGTPADYKAMWANVRSRFDAAGVTNVVWVMDYMNYAPWDCVVDDVYPGDDLVDWIVFNGYQTGDKDVSFVNRVGHLYALLTADSNAQHDYLSKPWGIGEWGIRTSSQASAYTYYSQARAAVEGDVFPRLKMFDSFDQNSPTTGEGSLRVAYDRSGAYDAAEQTAFDGFASSPALSGASTDIGSDRTPPTITLDSPADGTTVSGTVTVGGTASDDVALAGTTLLVDGQAAGSATGTSPGVTWDSASVGDGPHSLVLRTRDRAGNATDSAPATVTVHNVVPDTTPPTAPGSVTAAPAGAGAAQVTWSAASDDTGVTAYQVLRDGVPVATLGGSATSYTDSGLAEARTYSYTVSAADAAGNVGPAGGPATVTTADLTAPTSPTGLTASPTAHQVTLAWGAAGDNVGVTGYRVYRGGALVATTTGLGYTDTGLTDATGYQYAVVAVDAAGNAGAPAGVTTATSDGTPPTVPTGLTAAGGRGQVTLSWTASADNVGVTGYRVYRNGLLVATPTSPGYVDTGLGELATYTYTVAAQDAAGLTSSTATASATTRDSTAPTAPGSLTAKVSGTTVTLKWKAATDAGGVRSYTVLRNGVAIATTTALTYADATAPQGATATYTITATDNAGNTGAPSTGATAAVPDRTAPTAPAGLAATPGARQVRLTWTASTDNLAVTGYSVYRGSTRVATLTATTLTYTDTGLTSSRSYTDKVVAHDAAGNQSTGSTVTARAG